jgi:SAM-dependent methyltransferase
VTQQLLKQNSGIRLDIGCGSAKNEGFIGMDIRPLDDVDIVHDVESYPWPLPDNSVVLATCSHLVEHINPHKFGFINFMNECWRVMQPKGQLAISCPHANSHGFHQDPTHCNPINETTWAYFDPEFFATGAHIGDQLYNIYKPKPWRVAHLRWNPIANMEVILVKREMNDSNGKA